MRSRKEIEKSAYFARLMPFFGIGRRLNIIIELLLDLRDQQEGKE